MLLVHVYFEGFKATTVRKKDKNIINITFVVTRFELLRTLG